MLEKVLNGNASPRVKERALFVLAQSGSPRARQILADVARGNARPDLQEKAIHYLGISGGKGNGQLLAEIYASSTSVELKEKVLHAFMISGDKARVLEAARSEKSPELRAAATISIREALAPFVRGTAVMLGASIWIVTAQAS